MTKAGRIRELYAQGKTCGEIAEIVGCRVEYARVCAQQRIPGRGGSPADKQWKITAAEHIKRQRRDKARWRYATDPGFRARRRKAVARYQASLREGAP